MIIWYIRALACGWIGHDDVALVPWILCRRCLSVTHFVPREPAKWRILLGELPIVESTKLTTEALKTEKTNAN